jgi:hypothetical protein
MAESSYDLLFSKLPRARLFNDYYAEAGRVVARALLQPPEDRNVDICAQVSLASATKMFVYWLSGSDGPHGEKL